MAVVKPPCPGEENESQNKSQSPHPVMLCRRFHNSANLSLSEIRY
jgi:hypothetical protein